MLKVLDCNPDGILLVDRDGRIHYTNEEARRLIGRGGRDLVGDAFGIPTVQGDAAVVDIASPGGEPRAAEMRVSTIDWDGKPAYLIFFRDISGAEQLRLQVQRLARIVADRERRTDEFLAVLAHELRNALTPIVSGVQLMRLEPGGTPLQGKASELVEHQLRNLVRLIEDLLSAARSRVLKIRLEREPVDIDQLASKAARTMRPTAEAVGRRLLFRSRGPVWSEVDSAWIEQSLTHLLNNAVKFTDPGGTIELVARREGDSAVLRVIDDGIGIAPEMLPEVFGLFAQEDRSRARPEAGMGIGLAVVHQVIERHGGLVEVHSDGPGRGTEFALRLPLLRGGPAAQGPGPAPGGPG